MDKRISPRSRTRKTSQRVEEASGGDTQIFLYDPEKQNGQMDLSG